jgi:hypothetical protein
MGEPTGPIPAAPIAAPIEKDALRAALSKATNAAVGKASSRIARGLITGLTMLAAHNGFGWINPNDPSTNVIITLGSAALVNGAMAYARERWGGKVGPDGKPTVASQIVGWLPL